MRPKTHSAALALEKKKSSKGSKERRTFYFFQAEKGGKGRRNASAVGSFAQSRDGKNQKAQNPLLN